LQPGIGAAGQRRLQARLEGMEVRWVGVNCDPLVAAAREAARPDRVQGMAAAQALTVHDGVRYDIVVDTTEDSAEKCARQIADRLIPG
jgi:chloramphenicol 3-O phosphotransferase